MTKQELEILNIISEHNGTWVTESLTFSKQKCNIEDFKRCLRCLEAENYIVKGFSVSKQDNIYKETYAYNKNTKWYIKLLDLLRGKILRK